MGSAARNRPKPFVAAGMGGTGRRAPGHIAAPGYSGVSIMTRPAEYSVQ
jgi:hypothetical protein